MAIHLHKEHSFGDQMSLVAYRVLAILWILKGFLGACDLLGIPFFHWGAANMSGGRDTVFSALFAGLDIVAGVSLWLSVSWGAVIWFSVAVFYSFSVLVFAPGWHSVLSAFIVILLLLIHSGYRITLKKDAFIEKLKRS